MSKKRCRLAGDKVKFATHEAALIRAGEIMEMLKGKPDCPESLRTYRCPHGNHWHLTSTASIWPPVRNKREMRNCPVCKNDFFVPNAKKLRDEPTCSPRCKAAFEAKK